MLRYKATPMRFIVSHNPPAYILSLDCTSKLIIHYFGAKLMSVMHETCLRMLEHNIIGNGRQKLKLLYAIMDDYMGDDNW